MRWIPHFKRWIPHFTRWIPHFKRRSLWNISGLQALNYRTYRTRKALRVFLEKHEGFLALGWMSALHSQPIR
tara:strand:- start:85 stop:300 length:216 start_codon:yes stop_codon:yes gene_type:complete